MRGVTQLRLLQCKHSAVCYGGKAVEGVVEGRRAARRGTSQVTVSNRIEMGQAAGENKRRKGPVGVANEVVVAER